MVIGGTASYLLGATSLTLVALGLVTILRGALAAFKPVVWGLLQQMTPE